ncbi:hypothetical protein J4E93_009230 [Alternaria ventricosa]|uniref:uncharacterized protein n=1 Tax=Alternaria ventricosa TaxID=1187951 RepID=UPI0020C45C53|nr:uncharacterized protein J4E93_009230 [Alternaria ventricosa]KAI4639402.1 hypothetical protein J4E93_009230 [Alternaria ventricosa]
MSTVSVRPLARHPEFKKGDEVKIKSMETLENGKTRTVWKTMEVSEAVMDEQSAHWKYRLATNSGDAGTKSEWIKERDMKPA